MHSSTTDSSLWAIILAGGVGSRFWPVSTPSRPKQLLPLGSKQPLITDTVDRIEPLIPLERIRIMTGSHLASPILSAVPGLSERSLLLEPMAKGTAPALAWAAAELVRLDPNAVMISLHADHIINPPSEFLALLAGVGDLAMGDGLLYTIGIEPTRPETGYGYIRVGEGLTSEPGLYHVADFIEKPDIDSAKEYLLRGGYLWNSGLFIWRAATLLDELARHTPELADLLPYLEDGDIKTFFERAPNLSIDEGLLERSDRVAVARATFEWDDIGTWDAVARSRSGDHFGNISVGDAAFVESERCISWADEGSVVIFGADDLVVVRSGEITFVAPRARTAELKDLLSQLPDRLRIPGGEV